MYGGRVKMITALLHYLIYLLSTDAVNFSYNKAAFDFLSDAYRNVRKAKKSKTTQLYGKFIRKIDKSALPGNDRFQKYRYESSHLPAEAAGDPIQ